MVLEGRAALHELAGPLELLGGQARDEHVALAGGEERVHDAGDLLGRLALAVDDLARAAPGASREVELRIADVCHSGRGSWPRYLCHLRYAFSRASAAASAGLGSMLPSVRTRSAASGWEAMNLSTVLLSDSGVMASPLSK